MGSETIGTQQMKRKKGKEIENRIAIERQKKSERYNNHIQ